jgi:hypothetical protein
LRTRILPPEEWDRLKETELPPLLPYISPDNAAMVVVEDGDKVVASLAVLRATHLEGLWIDPERRGNAGVARALLRQATELVRVRGEQWALGGCADDRMRRLIGKLGGVQVPMELYALWVGGEGCRQQ